MAKCVFVLVLSVFLLCACSIQALESGVLSSSKIPTGLSENDTTSKIVAQKADTSPPAIESEIEPFVQEPTEPSSVMLAYLTFLLNKTNFYECFNRSEHTPYLYESFSEYLHGEDDITLEVTRFTVIDMNSDGIKELIISMRHPLSASVREIYLVLTCDDGTLYGITFTDRSFSNLLKDGTFFSSAVSPGHWGVMRLLYSSGVFWLEETRSPNYYEFYEEFWSFVEEQRLKEEAEWFPYNAETIAEDLAAAWELNTMRR